MDTSKQDARGFFKAAYGREQFKAYRRKEPYYLSPVFDVMVCVALLIALVGYFTA